MSPTQKLPSAVVWDWRGGDNQEARRAREAAAIRRRGLIGGAVGLAVAALVFFLLKRPVPAAVIAAVALLLSLPSLVAPLTAGRSVSRALDRFAHAVGTGVTWVLMTLLYYLLFLPAGLILRSRGKLAITRGFDPRRPSYWTSVEERERTRTPESYRRQF
ncbi:MAG TPA: hypothetical protein VKM72_29315 [Thermoanaerobaculia bacterium]|nr:hypothetical protein [Thermoanaerobaculia bacterium]